MPFEMRTESLRVLSGRVAEGGRGTGEVFKGDAGGGVRGEGVGVEGGCGVFGERGAVDEVGEVGG